METFVGTTILIIVVLAIITYSVWNDGRPPRM